MLTDPIVVRRVRGRYLVASNLQTDPVQLIRQVSDFDLEVHLKGGAKYVETVSSESELALTILELTGYRVETLNVSFHAWPKNENCRLNFTFDTPETATLHGEGMVNWLVEPIPFLSGSKFISLSMNAVEKPAHGYSAYDVKLKLAFWCRADMTSLLLDLLEEGDNLYLFVGGICDLAGTPRHDVLRNNLNATFTPVKS